jgi:multiple sugar transport system permease protein
MAITAPARRPARRPAWTIAAPFLLPYLVLFSVFLVWPLAYGFYISLHDWHLLAQSRPFVGLANYAAVWRDDLFLLALRNTAYFVALAVPAGNLVSLLIALGLNARVRGETLFRLLYYLPTILSVAVVAVLWKWLYSTEFGLINHYLGRQIPWITDPKLAMPSLAIASIWWGAGGGMLIYLAGLRAIPESYYEAAEIDGAGTWTRFWSITWPLLMPTTLFNLVVGLIGGFQMFGQAFMITGGGPHNATLTVVQYMYRTGFSLFKMGYGAAVAYSLFLVVLVVALLQFRLLAFKEENA